MKALKVSKFDGGCIVHGDTTIDDGLLEAFRTNKIASGVYVNTIFGLYVVRNPKNELCSVMRKNNCEVVPFDIRNSILADYAAEQSRLATLAEANERTETNSRAIERLEPYAARWAKSKFTRNERSGKLTVPPQYWRLANPLSLSISMSCPNGNPSFVTGWKFKILDVAKITPVSCYRFGVEHPKTGKLMAVRDDIPQCRREAFNVPFPNGWKFDIETRKIREISTVVVNSMLRGQKQFAWTVHNSKLVEFKDGKLVPKQSEIPEIGQSGHHNSQWFDVCQKTLQTKDGTPKPIRETDSFVTPCGHRVDGSYWHDETIIEQYRECPIVETSEGVKFDHETTTDETYRQRRQRLLACRRWRKRKEFGNKTTRNAFGERVPELNLGTWIDGNGREVCYLRRSDCDEKSGTSRYVQTAIRRAWIDLSIKIRPEFNLTYDRLFSCSLYREFREECEQQIVLHYLASLRGIERFSAVSRGIESVAKIFFRRYGYKGTNNELSHDIPIREKRTEADDTDALALFAKVQERALNGRDPKQRRLCDCLTRGIVKVSEIAKETSFAPSTIRNNLKLLRLLNRA